MGTAQEAFAAALKTDIAPALRAVGLRGSGSTFQLPSDTHFALIGFQRSQFSDSAAVKFTVNLKVVAKVLWESMRQQRSYLPSKPAANTGYGSFEWNKRIGSLMPGGQDHWWLVHADQDNRATFIEVTEVLVNVAVPALRSQVAIT